MRPVAAVVGGAKVSTKLDLLGNLVTKVNALVIGGAMANTFLSAQGHPVGRSLQEAEMHATALDILARAKATGCEVLLPTDAVVANELKPGVATQTVAIVAVPADGMILDVGPATVDALIRHLATWHTLVWNGPLGAFETPPFDAATALQRRWRTPPEECAAQCGGRGRHCLGATPAWRSDEPRLDRRGRLYRSGWRARRCPASRSAEALRPYLASPTSSCRMPRRGPDARSRSARDMG